MYLCYIDESGTPDIPGNTSHYILAGLSVPIWHWRDCDREISVVKQKYHLADSEIHTAWIARKYIEQSKIKDFKKLNYVDRRTEVSKLRKTELLKKQRFGNPKQFRQNKKNFTKTEPYIHLTYDERIDLLKELASVVSNWGYARLFAECVNKVYFDPARNQLTIDEQSFEQIISRFEQYLESISNEVENPYGLLIHDNNQTVCKKHTELMKDFHKKGTLYTKLKHIIETPLFVDSELTSMVQIADLCSYSLRRYLENDEEELFNLIFNRADRKHGLTVGVRHFSESTCNCIICRNHTR